MQCHGEMLLERRRAGERGRVEPGRHRDNHQRAEQHRAEQQQSSGIVQHMRQQPHQERPECVDANRDRDRIDDGGEENDGSVAVEQFAYAKVSIDAARQREHGERDARSHFEARNALA
jgi:hypothetical protein